MTPSLSVLFCVYNGERYLREALQSVLNQTFSDFELVIVDDGSTDATSKILDSFSDSRIVRLCNETNCGLVVSLNKAISHSHGKYLVRMDADDHSLPDRFQRQWDYMELHPEVGVLGCWMEQRHEVNGYREILKVPSEHYLIRWKMLFGTVIFHATVMMRRELVIRAGGYDERFQHIEDTELWSRLILNTCFANLEETLYVRRWHSESICNLHSKEQFRLGGKIRHKLLVETYGNDIDKGLVDRYSRKINCGISLGFLEGIKITYVVAIAAKCYSSKLNGKKAIKIYLDTFEQILKIFNGNMGSRIAARLIKLLFKRS